MPKKSPSKAQRSHLDRVAALGCIVCRRLGQAGTPAACHHIRTGQGMGQRSGHMLTIPLCGPHHQTGGHGVAIHAGQKMWEGLYGSELELLDETLELLERAS